MFRATRIAVAFLVLTASAALAQQTGRISGTVSEIDTRSTISNARVAVRTPQRVALTDAAGNYILRDLPAGTYKVYVSAIGRAPDSATVTVSAGSASVHDFALKEGSLMLSTMIVSATRAPVEASKVAATVDVLTPEQVKQSPVREAQDLLREIPSVELPRQSSLVSGTAQIVSIRGVDEGRTAVLFDGVPINDAWGEWIDWGRVPKAMLDRVEVVEGGTSSLYGNGAMGGAISFFSRPIAPGSMDLQVDGGSRDARHAYVAAGVPIAGALTASINGDYQQGGGYRLISQQAFANAVATCPCIGYGSADVESDVIQRNSYMRLNYAPSASWSAFASGHLFGDSRGLGTPLTFANRDQRDVDFGFNHESVFSGALALRAWDGRQIESQRASAFESNATRAVEDSSLTAQIPSHDWGASAQWTRSNAWHLESFSAGADFRHYQGDYNEVDFNTSACATNPPGAVCHSVTQLVSSGGNQNLSGAFVQATASPWSPFRIEASARVDQWNNNDGHAVATAGGVTTPTTYANKTAGAFSPRLGLRYQLASTFAVRAAAYKAFRAPNLAELYRKQVSSSSITIPNPQLSAENALGREAGFDWQPVSWLQARGTWYVADYNNFNVPTNLPTATIARPTECGTVATCRTRLNITKVRSQGGEASLAMHPTRQLYLSAGVNYDDARQETGLPANITNDQKPHVNRVPSPKQTIRGTWSSPTFGDWTAIWRHEGKTTTLQGMPLDPYSVIDANVDRQLLPNIRGFVSVENLTNKQYMINVGGAATAANPTVVTLGLPRTFRVGVEASRF